MRILILAFSLYAFLFIACEETEESCLDLLAENFSFTAVNACDSCCTYPTVSLRLNLLNDTLAFSVNDTLLLDDGDSIILRSLELVFSEFDFSNKELSYQVLDSLFRNGNSVKDDFVLFVNEGIKNIGGTRFQDSISSVRFLTGFNEAALSGFKPFDEIDQNSNLDLALDSLYNDEQDSYYSAVFEFEFNTRDSLIRFELNNTEIAADKTIDRFVSAGSDWRLDMTLDLNHMLAGVLFGQDKDVMEETILRNYALAISIE